MPETITSLPTTGFDGTACMSMVVAVLGRDVNGNLCGAGRVVIVAWIVRLDGVCAGMVGREGCGEPAVCIRHAGGTLAALPGPVIVTEMGSLTTGTMAPAMVIVWPIMGAAGDAVSAIWVAVMPGSGTSMATRRSARGLERTAMPLER